MTEAAAAATESVAAEASETEPAGSTRPGRRVSRLKTDRLDRWLDIAAAGLFVAILVLAIVFGLTVYNTRRSVEGANPALRTIDQVRDQVRANPNDAGLRVRLGEALGIAGLYPEAVEQFEAALRIEPEHIGAYLDLGLLAVDTEDWDAAEGFFTKVLELTEGDEFEDVSNRRELAMYYLGRLALNDGRYEDAIGFFKGALRIRQDASDTYYYVAQAYQGLGEEEEAIDNLLIAIEFDPKYAQAHFILGEIYLDQDEKLRAAYHFREAVEASPDADPPLQALLSLGPPEQWTSAAQEALAAEEYETALEHIELARYIEPDSLEAILLHGQILEAQGDTGAALTIYKDAERLDPENQEVLDAIERLS